MPWNDMSTCIIPRDYSQSMAAKVIQIKYSTTMLKKIRWWLVIDDPNRFWQHTIRTVTKINGSTAVLPLVLVM